MSQLSGRPGSPGPETPVAGSADEDLVGQRADAGPREGYVPDERLDLSRVVGADGDDGGDNDADEADERGFGASVGAAFKEFAIVVVLALALSFVVKSWLFQAFYIPSGSMEDTLVKDDRVIVSKLTPGPFDLQRGDVVVFEDPDCWLCGSISEQPEDGPLHKTLVFVGLLPEDSENHLIKRVIGLPGDHVQSDGSGKLKVNGVEITEPYIKPGDAPSNMAFDIVVPQGRVWVMGDHRGDSADSRFHDDGKGGTGSVPIDKIVGRALFVVWPFDHVTWLGTPERTFAKVPVPTPGLTPKPKNTGVVPGSVVPDKTPTTPKATSS